MYGVQSGNSVYCTCSNRYIANGGLRLLKFFLHVCAGIIQCLHLCKYTNGGSVFVAPGSDVIIN